MDLEEFKNRSQTAYNKNKQLSKKLKKIPVKELDKHFHQLHEEAFENIDCLSCANCCKTTGPLFTSTDINRIARKLGMKPNDFIDEYLKIDEDRDYVLQSVPCTFLGADNMCLIYEDRPKACREYPHTDRKNMKQIMNLTVKNTLVCPAVLRIFEKIEEGL